MGSFLDMQGVKSGEVRISFFFLSFSYRVECGMMGETFSRGFECAFNAV